MDNNDKIIHIITKLKLENKTNFLEDILIAFQENIPDKVIGNNFGDITGLDKLMKYLGAIVLHWRNQHKPLSEQHQQTIDFLINILD